MKVKGGVIKVYVEWRRIEKVVLHYLFLMVAVDRECKVGKVGG